MQAVKAKKRMARLFVLLIVVVLVLTGFTLAAPGDLDISFDTDGFLTTAIGSGNDLIGYTIAVQSDGKIVVPGQSNNGTDNDFALVRYNTDGSLDTSFDTDGIVTTAVGSGLDFGYGVALQPDSKIVMAGYSHNGSNFDFAVVRYCMDGRLDDGVNCGPVGFGAGGVVTTPVGTGHDRAYAVAIQSNGQIVVAGYSRGATNNDFAVVRYNTDGSLDTTGFGNPNGYVLTDIGSTQDQVYGISIQSDGKIVVAGCTNTGSNATYYDIALVRYNTDGSLDTSFDGDGIVTTAIRDKNDFAYGIAIQSDGKIVVAGYGTIQIGGSHDDFILARYNTDGSLDTSFDSDGKVVTDFALTNDHGHAITIQPDGKIVVAGYSSNATDQDFAVARYTCDGSLDTSFGTDGMVSTAIGSSNEQIYAVTSQPSDGRIVVAGNSFNGSYYDFALARYKVAEEATETVSNGGTSTTLPSVTITNHSGGSCQFTVVKHPVPPGGAPPDPGEMPVYWEISTTCDPINVDLMFNYTDCELANGNSVDEASLQVYKPSGGWVCQGGTVDMGANTVNLTGVSSLSGWTIASSSPSAVSLASFKAATDLPGWMLLVVLNLGVMTIAGLLLFIVRRYR